MLTFYFDEDSMSRGLVEALRQRSIDVMTASDVGNVPASDEQHLEFATSQSRVLYSSNVGDFFALHSRWLTSGKSHSGIVGVKQQLFGIGEQMRRLLNLANSLDATGMIDRFEFLQDW